LRTPGRPGNALRGLLIGTPSNALVDIVVLVVAGVAVASALLRRLLR
jgi:ABC-2 type transport system permease protein